MSGGPANASVNEAGLRSYTWTDPDSGQEHSLLSVTTIRKLCGEQYPLVQWQLGNLINAAMGTTQRPAIGKRGKPLKGKYVYAPNGTSEFVERMLAAEGSQPKLDDIRRWLRDTADQPRDIAAVRGTIVHSAIEKNITYARVSRPWVESEYGDLSEKDKAKLREGVTDADVRFVQRAVANYWDMRQKVPFYLIAREPQVFNLELGYAGSADGLIWFLPEGFDEKLPKPHLITLKFIESIGGFLAVGDWKTSRGVYTDHVVQCHAYGAGEFVGEDGVINRRLSDILEATQRGVLFHIRPENWGVHVFDFSEPVFRAFAGSVAFARFLFEYPHPWPLFIADTRGSAPDSAEDEEAA